MKAAPDNILIYLSEEERRKLFEKPIVNNEGKLIWLVTGIPADAGLDESFSQGLDVGIVMGVGRDVQGIEVGDTALVDYIVDLSEEYVVESDDRGKLVSLRARTIYETEDLIVDANRRTPHPTVVQRRGDLREPSMIIAVIRGKEILPNEPYIFFTHTDEGQDWRRTYSIYTQEKPVVVRRKVVAVYPGSTFQAGDEILIEEEAIFDRMLAGNRFDIAFEHDLLCRWGEHGPQMGPA